MGASFSEEQATPFSFDDGFDYRLFLSDPDNFVVGFDLCKSADGNADEWLVDGISSVEHQDQDDELVVQKGMDFSPFQRSGYINWDHKDSQSPAYLIGEPREVKLVDLRTLHHRMETPLEGLGLYIKGELYKNKPVARAVWEHLQATSGLSSRKLGWSVQGRVLERDPLCKSKITRCVVHHVAITHQPVNQFTFASLVKSMTTANAEPLLTENLYGARTGHPVMTTLFGQCEAGSQCYDRQLAFYRREHGALDHMVKCRQANPGDAMALIKTLRSRGYRF